MVRHKINFLTFVLFFFEQLLALCLLSEGQELYLHWGHKVTGFLF